jgi:hypothetical protein
MATWATWNVKAADNIACWTCEHFQRYDDSDTPTDCEGECRKNSPQWMAADKLYSCDPPPEEEKLQEGYFTFIPFGNTSWCNGYQRSLEDNIPPAPATKWDCPHQETKDFTTPFQVRDVPGPFNKKDVLDSCWYCTHFQRFNEEESMENWACHGYCQIKPPQAWTLEFPFWAGPNECMGTFFIFPWVRFAPRVWCSRWERNPRADELPAPPEQNGVLCGPTV